MKTKFMNDVVVNHLEKTYDKICHHYAPYLIDVMTHLEELFNINHVSKSNPMTTICSDLILYPVKHKNIPKTHKVLVINCVNSYSYIVFYEKKSNFYSVDVYPFIHEDLEDWLCYLDADSLVKCRQIKGMAPCVERNSVIDIDYHNKLITAIDFIIQDTVHMSSSKLFKERMQEMKDNYSKVLNGTLKVNTSSAIEYRDAKMELEIKKGLKKSKLLQQKH